VGIFLSLSNNLQYTAQQISKNLVVVFFLEKDLPEKNTQTIENEIRKSSIVTRSQFISAEEALANFQEKFPELREIIENLKLNPFPPSFEISFEEKNLLSIEISTFIERIKILEGVEDVQYNKDWIERMQSLSRLARAIGYFLGGILVLASFFIISNIIKLNVFARKEEIQILRLVGATNTFIRIPFIIEGVAMGTVGGLMSLILLFAIIKLFPLYLGPSLGVLNEFINFRYLSLSQCFALTVSGSAIGFFGSVSSLARFLKT